MKQRFAICNETFGDWPWPRVCETVAALGYEGIEIAPFTFGTTVDEVSAAQRAEIRRVAVDSGLEIVGLHWLLLTPPGLHLHSIDEPARLRTVDYLRKLIDFAGDVDASVMVLGSPKQRRLENDDFDGAWKRTRDSLTQLLPLLEARGVLLCQESLPAPDCDFIQTAAEAVRMIEEIGQANYRLMLDTRSMSHESRPMADLIRDHCSLLHHVHANDANGRGPGFGDTDFAPVAEALRECEYTGYVSVEVFDYLPDPETIARESIRYLREIFA